MEKMCFCSKIILLFHTLLCHKLHNSFILWFFRLLRGTPFNWMSLFLMFVHIGPAFEHFRAIGACVQIFSSVRCIVLLKECNYFLGRRLSWIIVKCLRTYLQCYRLLKFFATQMTHVWRKIVDDADVFRQCIASRWGLPAFWTLQIWSQSRIWRRFHLLWVLLLLLRHIWLLFVQSIAVDFRLFDDTSFL